MCVCACVYPKIKTDPDLNVRVKIRNFLNHMKKPWDLGLDKGFPNRTHSTHCERKIDFIKI